MSVLRKAKRFPGCLWFSFSPLPCQVTFLCTVTLCRKIRLDCTGGVITNSTVAQSRCLDWRPPLARLMTFPHLDWLSSTFCSLAPRWAFDRGAHVLQMSFRGNPEGSRGVTGTWCNFFWPFPLGEGKKGGQQKCISYPPSFFLTKSKRVIRLPISQWKYKSPKIILF